jgi:kynureninase
MDDVVRAAEALERIVRDGLWDRPEFHKRAAVT